MSTGTGPRRLGRYELQERLGRGGMAEVWKALDTQLQRYVAIKVLHPNLRADPNFTSRFEREAQLIAALHHPNIVQIYDFQVTSGNGMGSGSNWGSSSGSNWSSDIWGSDGNSGAGSRDHSMSGVDNTRENDAAAYMIMDYVEGQTLADYLHETVQQGKFLPADELLHLFAPICQAIDYAHGKGMVHRDLKPANILLDARNRANNPAGEPIISDFGISKMLNDQTQTQHGFWLGTPAYIAPEQVQGERTTSQSDIYALAIMLYETCTGTLPFHADGPIALAMQHVNGTPTPPNLINPQISDALAAVIMKGLEKDPNKRFASATEMLQALSAAIGGNQQQVQGRATTNSGEFATQQAFDEADQPTYLIPQYQTPQYHPQTPTPLPPVAPVPLQPSASSFVPQASTDAATVLTTPTPPTPPQAPEKAGSRRRPLLIALVAAVILALVGGAFFVLPRFTTSTPVAGQTSVGALNFLNSGQYNQDGSAGITDEAQVTLNSLPAPDAGKAYYAWLLSDAKSQNQQSLLLGKLSVANGKGQLMFQGDANHSNLLARYSRFLLTMENAGSNPSQPGAKNTWRYYGEIPNIPIPSDTISHYSLLDHMRHLVSDDPTLNVIGLHGGLNLWFGRNTEKLLEATSSARDEMNTALVHRQVVRSIDYLDGQVYSKVDVPAGTNFLIDPLAGQVGLLTFNSEQPLPGLLSHIMKHLQGLAEAPGVMPDQVKLANQLAQQTQVIEKEMSQARDDAKKLAAMDETQLGQPAAHTLLNDLYTQINQAYVGQRDPNTGELRGGVEQVSAQILHLSMVDIKAYAQ